MHHTTSTNNSTTQTNQQLVANALTMQKALETAYNDWNKEKNKELTSEMKSTTVDNELVVTSKDSTTTEQEETSTKTKPISIEKNNKHLEKTSDNNTSPLSSSLPSINDLKPESENLSKTKSSHKSKNKHSINKDKHQKSLDELTQIDCEAKNADGVRSSSSLSSNPTTEIAYYYGNPTVDLVKGFLHIYKDW